MSSNPKDLENQLKAIQSLESFLEPVQTDQDQGVLGQPKEAQVASLPSKEHLEADLKVILVKSGLSSNKLLEQLLKAHDSGKELDSFTLRNFNDIYSQISENLKSFDYQDREFLQNFLDRQLILFSRKSFYMYVRYMAPLILPEGFIDGKHIKLMSDSLQEVERATGSGKKKRKMLFLPPGAMKSKLINLFVSWCLGKHPKWNILHIGHGTQFVEDNAGRPIRDLMRTEEYLRVFPAIIIKSDSRAAGRWETSDGGKYYAAGVGSQIAGRRAHIAICDDVVSEQTAYSVVERRGINAWYVPGLRTRLLPNGSEIVVNTRWHVEDLSGYLIKNDQGSKRPWEIIKIPAILDFEASKLLKMKEGESFWPEFQPLEFLQERKDDPSMTASKWSALYMQEPVPEEGNIIGEKDFMYWSKPEPPALDFIIISIDTAFSLKKTADYNAYSVWGLFHKKTTDMKGREMLLPCLILLEAKRFRCILSEMATIIQETYDFYKPDIVLIEEEARGRDLYPELQLRGFPVIPFSPSQYGDKGMRLHACSPFFKSGRIWVPDSQDFTNDLVEEVSQVPNGAHDDIADTMTQAILYLRDSFGLSNPSYMKETWEEDERSEKKKSKTYWSQATAA